MKRNRNSDEIFLKRERHVATLLKSVSPGVVGARLRRARLRMGLSIRDLSSASQVSKNSIVRLELGNSPSALTLMKVCAILGIHIESLAKPTPAGDQFMSVHRQKDDRWYDLTDFDAGPLGGIDAPQSAAQRKRHVRKGAKVPLMILKSRLETGRLLPTVIELYSESDRRSHAGEEFVYVLRGSAKVRIGNKSVVLKTGEAVTFWSAELHSYAPATGSALPAQLLSVRIDDRPER